jgi:hypothetical protein
MQRVNEDQIAFGRLLDLELEGKSISEALAMLHDVVDRDFLGQSDLGAPDWHHAAGTRGVSATRIAPTSNEVVT